MHSENTLYLSRKDIICVVVDLEIINIVCHHSLGSLTNGNLFFIQFYFSRAVVSNLKNEFEVYA